MSLNEIYHYEGITNYPEPAHDNQFMRLHIFPKICLKCSLNNK